MSLRKWINRLLGSFLLSCGYSIERSYRTKRCTLPLLEIVYLALSSASSPISILQIGAFDGGSSNPLRNILKQGNVQALLVEPQPLAYQALCERFRDSPYISVLEAVVSDQDGIRELYVPSDSAVSQVASLSRQHVAERSPGVQRLQVPSVTVASLLTKFPFSQISLLQIDAEGADALIINQFLDLDVLPNVINFESFHLPRAERINLMQRLEACGYLLLDYGLDTLAVQGGILVG